MHILIFNLEFFFKSSKRERQHRKEINIIYTFNWGVPFCISLGHPYSYHRIVYSPAADDYPSSHELSERPAASLRMG